MHQIQHCKMSTRRLLKSGGESVRTPFHFFYLSSVRWGDGVCAGERRYFEVNTMKANTSLFSDLLTFIDTAGQEQYQEHRKEAIEAGHGYLMVYDITQR